MSDDKQGATQLPEHTTAKPAVAIYYNSACPVCKAGIRAQTRRMQQQSPQLHDIHVDGGHNAGDDDSDIIEAIGSPREFVRERLHVVDQQGRIQVGIDAFITLWNITPADRWKARLLSLPAINTVASSAYNVFARALYQWNRRRGRW